MRIGKPLPLPIPKELNNIYYEVIRMTALLPKLGSIALVVGTLIATAAPSFAFPGCNPFHPRRAEVFRRDAVLRHEINGDRGYLRGHYGQLMGEDRGILRQERRDLRRNGGYLTSWQAHKLNREENRLQRQINWDHRGL